jgi:hypothetical protein
MPLKETERRTTNPGRVRTPRQDAEDSFARAVRQRYGLDSPEYAKVQLGQAKAALERFEAAVKRAAKRGGQKEVSRLFGTSSYIRESRVALLKRVARWEAHLGISRKDRRNSQLRKARQAYEARHPERANRFERFEP